MAWLPASFRGVAFHVADEERTGGRRLAVHEYPDPVADRAAWPEDLGPKAPSLTFTAFILGADYLQRAAELADALNARGPGRLVLPRGGDRMVVIDQWSMRLETGRQRSAEFSISAIDAGERRSALIDHAGAASSASEGVLNVAKTRFESTFNVLQSLDWIEAEGRDHLTAATEAIRDSIGPSITGVSRIVRFGRAAEALVADAARLVRTPAEIPGRLLDLLGQAGGNGSLRGIWGSLTSWSWTGGVAPSDSTAARRMAATNRAALDRLVTRQAVARAAVAATAADYATANELEDAAAFIGEATDRALDDGGADSGDLLRLRSAALSALAARAASAPRVIEVVPGATSPAIVLAQRLYGDDPALLPARTADIAARNAIAHPSYVPGGRAIKVIAP